MIKDITKSKQAIGLLALCNGGHKEQQYLQTLFIQAQQTTLSIQTSFFSEDHGTPSNKMADCKDTISHLLRVEILFFRLLSIGRFRYFLN
jgi:hypothetical protein